MSLKAGIKNGACLIAAEQVKGFWALKMDEQTLIKLYMELTGMPEAAGRDVFMMVCKQDGQDPAPTEPTDSPLEESGERGGGFTRQDLRSIRGETT